MLSWIPYGPAGEGFWECRRVPRFCPSMPLVDQRSCDKDVGIWCICCHSTLCPLYVFVWGAKPLQKTPHLFFTTSWLHQIYSKHRIWLPKCHCIFIQIRQQMELFSEVCMTIKCFENFNWLMHSILTNYYYIPDYSVHRILFHNCVY